MTWKTLTVAAAPVFFLAACAMPPEGTGAEDVENYVAAVASIGCDVVNDGDYQALEIQTGLSQEQLVEMGEYLVDSQQGARLSNGGIRSMVGACAPVVETATPTEPAQG